MKQGFRRVTALLLTGLLFLSVQGCQASAGAFVQKRFDTYISSLVPQLMGQETMEINILFKEKSAYGFEEATYELPRPTQVEYEAAAKVCSDAVKKLSRFPDAQLREDQRLTKAVALDHLRRGRKLYGFYELDSSPLGSFKGMQAELPLLLSQYEFFTKADLESYFHLLESAPKTFETWARQEAERQRNGTGLAPSVMKKAIGQCRNFTKEKRPFLVDSINQKIDAASFLSDGEKAAAKQKSEALLTGAFLTAYRTLGEKLAAITVTCPEQGLAARPRGREYYTALLQANLGTDWSVQEVNTFIEKQIERYRQEAAQLKTQAPGAWEAYMDGKTEYPEFANVKECLQSLREAASKEFPLPEGLNFRADVVPESMRENFSPAAYFLSRFDASAEVPEQIWLNGDFTPDLYATLAHEGYPGHMAQNTYFKSTLKQPLRYVLGYAGYSEGWATYVESLSWKFAGGSETQQAVRRLEQINQMISGLYYCLFDIGIHDMGWTYEQFFQYLEATFGKNQFSDAAVWDTFERILETPANYPSYYVGGSYFAQLYADTRAKLSTAFDAKEFHTVLLRCGPAPQSVIEKQVDAWCKKKLKSQKNLSATA